MAAKRVTIVTDELLGFVKTGGLGTGASFLALALARMGHDVDVLYIGTTSDGEVDEPWGSRYSAAGIEIRRLRGSGERVEPPFFARMLDVERALRAHPTDVVVTQDLAAPTYTALRQRQLGLAFGNTSFVVNCYGTRRWITDMSAKIRVLPGAHAVTVLERASLELADGVVSPSYYLVEWMRGEGWRLPETTTVIPYYTESAAVGAPHAPGAPVAEGPVRRIAFFGRLEERKGIALFVEALNLLEPRLLEGIEIVFLGRATPAWQPARIEALLSERVRRTVSAIVFETDLDQPEALASLGRLGTLAVLPSYGETFGNAARECLEHGIPFLASAAGALPELVAREDWERTLFLPTVHGTTRALERRLSSDAPLEPARTAIDESTLDARWTAVLDMPSSRSAQIRDEVRIDVVIVRRDSRESLAHCLSALADQTYGRFRAIVVDASATRDSSVPQDLPFETILRQADAADDGAARKEGLAASDADWLVFLDQDDAPYPRLLETLVRAQAASQADVVTCGIELAAGGVVPAQHLFLGESGGLSVLSNTYGTVALIRRALLSEDQSNWQPGKDRDWALLAGLCASGAHIVSVPSSLVACSAPPGALENDPAAAFLVAQHLEASLPRQLEGLARLAAGVAADAATVPRSSNGQLPHLARRVRHALRSLTIRR